MIQKSNKKILLKRLIMNQLDHKITVMTILGIMISGQGLDLNNWALASQPSEPKHVYPHEVKKTYLRGCEYTNTPVFCQCTIDQLQAKYSFQTFRQLENEYLETKKIPPEVLEIFWFCRKQSSSK
jgi:hypothetical protein